MLIIDTPEAMAHALATCGDTGLRQRLEAYQVTLREAECEIGDLGPLLILEPADTAHSIQEAVGIELTDDPTWEYCTLHCSWYEIVFVTSDDGSGVVLLMPDRDDLDPTMRAIIQAAATPTSA